MKGNNQYRYAAGAPKRPAAAALNLTNTTSREPELPDFPPGDLWVFGYGSLMWRPGFEFLERQTARLYGYHRALCVWSWVHRGTPEQPGLVFGLDAGGSCVGRAFRVCASRKHEVAEYLYQREMVTAVYRPRLQRIYQANGQQATALTFIVDRQHVQYAGRLNAAQAAAVVARSHGQSGPNPDYLLSTLLHMEELGIREPELNRVREHLHQLQPQVLSGQ